MRRQSNLFPAVNSADGLPKFLLDLLIVVICQYVRLPGDLTSLAAHRDFIIDSIEIVCRVFARLVKEFLSLVYSWHGNTVLLEDRFRLGDGLSLRS